MAKFRKNHLKEGRRSAGFGYLGRVVMFSIVLIGGLIYLFKFLNSNLNTKPEIEYNIPKANTPEERYYIPSNSNGKIVHHDHYSLSYIENYEQAEWVAYELTKASILVPNVERSDWYEQDSKVPSESAKHNDYSNTGYTRGHLAPAGDMAFDKRAMDQSFYMSNMSPQLRSFNNGIWRELEEQTRDWAFENEILYITTGPVLQGIDQFIGNNRVGVPQYFYKVILDLSGREQKGIGFIIQNKLQTQALQEFAVSIDSVEALTGIDFFSGLMSKELEKKIESAIDLNQWQFSQKRFHERVDVWNHQ